MTIYIDQTIAYVKSVFANAESGHDWWHTYRVWKMAKQLSETEKTDSDIVELAALLHDISDAKFNGGDEEAGTRKAGQFLETIGVEPQTIHQVEQIIKNVSFKGGNAVASFHSPELMVVQDADRLDAIGAIGIARAFSYGGYQKRAFYNPDDAPKNGMSPEQYRQNQSTTINHFHEKLLLLKDRMNTNTAKKIAQQRHQFMQLYLSQFFIEWEAADAE